ncbi:hypothetical protein D3C76_1799280 [compost metagenome]
MSSASPWALFLFTSISTNSDIRLCKSRVYAVVEPTAPVPITAIRVALALLSGIMFTIPIDVI